MVCTLLKWFFNKIVRCSGLFAPLVTCIYARVYICYEHFETCTLCSYMIDMGRIRLRERSLLIVPQWITDLDHGLAVISVTYCTCTSNAAQMLKMQQNKTASASASAAEDQWSPSDFRSNVMEQQLKPSSCAEFLVLETCNTIVSNEIYTTIEQ